MKQFWIIVSFLWLLASIVAGQPPGQVAKVARLRLYDTTAVNPNIKAKHPTIDIDSLSFELWSWGEECWFRIDLANALMTIADSIRIDTLNDFPRVRFYSQKLDYELMVTESGNFEWFAILKEKPPSRSITFNIETEGLIFSYQPELTQAEIDNGSTRPDSVVGSYVAYHANKRNNVTYPDGSVHQYTTGKAFHMYCAYTWDDAGDTVKIGMEIDTVASTLTFSLPTNQWKNQATYPVTIDPIFGKSDVGGTQTTWYKNKISCAYQVADAAGEVNYSVWYCSNDATTGYYNIVMYSHTAGSTAPDTCAAVGSLTELVGYATRWDSVAVGTFNFVAGDTLWMGGHVSTNNLNLNYDVGATNQMRRDNEANPPGIGHSFTVNSSAAYNVSCYINYTASDGAPFKYRRRRTH